VLKRGVIEFIAKLKQRHEVKTSILNENI